MFIIILFLPASLASNSSRFREDTRSQVYSQSQFSLDARVYLYWKQTHGRHIQVGIRYSVALAASKQ